MNDQLALKVEYVKKTNEKDIYFNGNKGEREKEKERGEGIRGRWRVIKQN